MEKFSKFNDKQIKNLINNYLDQKQTAAPYYYELLEESARRSGNGLNFEKTLAAVKQAASEGRFLSYLDIADFSGCTWNKVRHSMNSHLQALLEYCYVRNIPLLSAIVVNKPSLKSGAMDQSALSGFVKGVTSLGIRIDDPESFLREEQAKIFAWANSSQ
ncbi:MAG: hypothetical protein ABI673_00320 [Novosphingobium sp.]